MVPARFMLESALEISGTFHLLLEHSEKVLKRDFRINEEGREETQLVECLPCMHKNLSWIHNTSIA